MIVVRHPNGDLEVPVRLATPDDLADGTERLTSSHPDYAAWLDAIDSNRVSVVNSETES